MRLYEGMFLVDHNLARTNYEEIESHIRGILERFGGEVVQMVKWAERSLAYPIKFNNKEYKKGAYILVHFNSEPDAIIKMNRQFRLSEMVVRHMILRDEDGLFDESKKYDELFETSGSARDERHGPRARKPRPDEGREEEIAPASEQPKAEEAEPPAEESASDEPEAGEESKGDEQ